MACPICGAVVHGRGRHCSNACQLEAARRTRWDDRPPIQDRLRERIEVDDAGCWIWTGPIAANGYARHGDQWAHRVSYEAFVGPIPEGLHIDHLCRVTTCINPDHLEPVTARVNTLRGATVALKTHCANGHPWIPENQAPNGPGRKCCGVCKRERQRRAA